MYKTIRMSDLDYLLKMGGVLIDCRNYNEYLNKHLDNAINIPLSNITSILNKYTKDKILIFYCKSGVRSLKACNIMSLFGYTKIYNLKIEENSYLE